MAEIRDVVDGQPVQAEKPTDPQSKGVLDPPVDDPIVNDISNFFGIETESERLGQKDKLDTIIKWAKSQTEDHSPENIKWVIRDLEFKLGSPGIGEKIIDYVYQYVGLVGQKQDIDSKLKKFNPYAKH